MSSFCVNYKSHREVGAGGAGAKSFLTLFVSGFHSVTPFVSASGAESTCLPPLRAQVQQPDLTVPE